ncbi:hypothetical protein AMR42_02390 [Limnothrix sp. PR1529]|nr:hypothetical protein BCR12_18430 [Limnothrix sp. P13C2]PIB15151.1 hypothetical protein AMR42_02390 [Limnothrix sp. PR1529]
MRETWIIPGNWQPKTEKKPPQPRIPTQIQEPLMNLSDRFSGFATARPAQPCAGLALLWFKGRGCPPSRQFLCQYRF